MKQTCKLPYLARRKKNLEADLERGSHRLQPVTGQAQPQPDTHLFLILLLRCQSHTDAVPRFHESLPLLGVHWIVKEDADDVDTHVDEDVGDYL